MKNQITKKELRRRAFKEEVYEALRDYQRDKVPSTGVSAGRLGDKMTVVFDRIIKASEQFESR